ncbi:MAG: molybdopterin-dependent oxidoreductase [Betaproteobacteria bacterium]|nr:molybdopterin-dependent oxidoreductase [Betaproteobacteria bacterium]
MEPLSRRRFLKISAATFGAGAVGSQVPVVSSLAMGSKPPTGKVETIATYCEMCFWKCGGIAHVRDGKLWKFEGNPLDPMSRGRLCPRGTGAVGTHYDPDRLSKPLIRTGERGKEEFKAVTWDEALNHIAEKMKKIAAEHGPESIALWKHGTGARFFEHVMRAYGCVNKAAPSFAQCRGPRDVGYLLTYGTGLGSPEPTDIANTKCLVLIGTHLGENMHNTQVQEFAEAIANKATIIVVDPRYSVAASKAKYWLPIKPGTDIALVLAWMNVLVAEGLYDRDFVAKYGHGFDKFATAIAPNTPEWAEAETGIPAATIRATAREIASHRPAALVHPGRRVNWYGDDTQRARATALLNALLGNWGRKGGLFLQAGMSVGGYPFPKFPAAGKPKLDNPDHKWPFADEEVTTGLREATITGKPYPIKSWVVYATNLVQTLPNEKETIEAISKLDLLVVVDTHPSEIAGYADVVLPDAMFLERHDDLYVAWGRQGWAALRQPVVPPPAEQKPAWWIAKQLADRLGVGEFMPFKDMDEYLAKRCEKSGIDYAKFRKDGIVMGEKTPITIEEGAAISFDTPSKKVEFWSDQLAKAGFDPVPKYTAPESAPAGYFPLITGRSPVHTFSRTQTNVLLRDLMKENEVWVNAQTAAKAGLKHGQYVKLKNQDGVVSNRVKVKATQRIRPDTLYMVYGFGHTNRMLKSAYLKGASAAQLNTRYKVDPLMGGTSIHRNFVTFEKEA